MSEGTGFRDTITDLIDNFGSAVVIVPRTPTTGNYGGYEPGSDGTGTSVTTVGIPSGFLKLNNGEKFGKMRGGETVIILKYDEVVNINSYVEWQSDSYSLKEIKDIVLQGVVVGIRLRISRRIKDGV